MFGIPFIMRRARKERGQLLIGKTLGSAGCPRMEMSLNNQKK
jgi:hypothetical protein